MKIVVLDGYTLNPGDLDWSPLRELGECVIYDRSSRGEVVPRLAGADVALTNKTSLERADIERLPGLRYIGVLATGYNIVDVAAASGRNIVVTNVPDYSTFSVAQLTFCHILNLTHRVAEHSASVRAGEWCRSSDFSYTLGPLTELSGLTLGIVGYGRIGSRVAAIAQAFGMHVLAHDPTYPAGSPIMFCALDELLRRSDVVTLHCPLNESSRNMIDSNRLGLMKREAFLINTSRGPLIDEHALAGALNTGRIAGAGLDVLSTEPPTPHNPLLSARNCYFTPHIAWSTRAARQRLLGEVVANLRAFVAGQPRNVVG